MSGTKCGHAKMLSKEYLISSLSFLSVEYCILDDSLLRRYSHSQVFCDYHCTEEFHIKTSIQMDINLSSNVWNLMELQ